MVEVDDDDYAGLMLALGYAVGGNPKDTPVGETLWRLAAKIHAKNDAMAGRTRIAAGRGAKKFDFTSEQYARILMALRLAGAAAKDDPALFDFYSALARELVAQHPEGKVLVDGPQTESKPA